MKISAINSANSVRINTQKISAVPEPETSENTLPMRLPQNGRHGVVPAVPKESAFSFEICALWTDPRGSSDSPASFTARTSGSSGTNSKR